MEERPFPWPREAERDAGQDLERDERRPKNGRFLMGRGTRRSNSGMRDVRSRRFLGRNGRVRPSPRLRAERDTELASERLEPNRQGGPGWVIPEVQDWTRRLLFHLMPPKLVNSGSLCLLWEHPDAPCPAKHVPEGELQAVGDAPPAPGAGAATATTLLLHRGAWPEVPRLPGTCSARTSVGGRENLSSQQLCSQSGAVWHFYPAKMWNFMSFLYKREAAWLGLI